MLQGELSDLHSSQHVSISVNVDIVNCIYQVTDLIGLGQPQFNSFASHAQHTHCTLRILLRLGLSDDSRRIHLAIPPGRSEIPIPIPF